MVLSPLDDEGSARRWNLVVAVKQALLVRQPARDHVRQGRGSTRRPSEIPIDQPPSARADPLDRSPTHDHYHTLLDLHPTTLHVSVAAYVDRLTVAEVR